MEIVSRSGAARRRQVPGLLEWLLSSDDLRLCVPPDHLLAGADEVTVAQLRDDAWTLCPDSVLGSLIAALCTTAGYEAQLAATAKDLGTALGPAG